MEERRRVRERDATGGVNEWANERKNESSEGAIPGRRRREESEKVGTANKSNESRVVVVESKCFARAD